MLVSELRELKRQSKLVSVERNCHDEELTGVICHIDDSVIAMHLYDDNGEYEGFTVFETEQVTEVYWGNREHRAIHYLASYNLPVETPTFKNETFQDIILELNSSCTSVCLHTSDSENEFDIVKILKSDEDWFKVQSFAIKKSLSPLVKLIARENITRVVVNSPYQTKIVELHSVRM